MLVGTSSILRPAGAAFTSKFANSMPESRRSKCVAGKAAQAEVSLRSGMWKQASDEDSPATISAARHGASHSAL